jgi:hypothetical protein
MFGRRGIFISVLIAAAVVFVLGQLEKQKGESLFWLRNTIFEILDVLPDHNFRLIVEFRAFFCVAGDPALPKDEIYFQASVPVFHKVNSTDDKEIPWDEAFMEESGPVSHKVNSTDDIKNESPSFQVPSLFFLSVLMAAIIVGHHVS